MKKIIFMFVLLSMVLMTSITYAVNPELKVSFTTRGNMQEIEPFVFADLLELSDMEPVDGIAFNVTNILYFYIGGQLQNMQTMAYISDGAEEYFIYVNDLNETLMLRSNNVLDVAPGMWYETDTLVEIMFDGYDDEVYVNDMGDVIKQVVNFFVEPINDALVYLGVDMSLIPITVGFYEPWFNITLYDLVLISLTIFIWLFMIRLIWKIFKGIFKRVVKW